MKHLKHVTWVLLAAILLLSLVQGQEILRLNVHSLQVVKASFDPAEISNPVTRSISISDPTLNCHLRWFELLLKYRQQPVDSDDPIFGEVISCSSLIMRMLRKMYPMNLELAKLSALTYPDQTFPLYWIFDITNSPINPNSRDLIEKIIELNPKEGLAWRYLGLIYLQEGNISEAISAHINSCLNGDPGFHGCHGAGSLLEQEGEYDQAIYFYRLSRWQVSQQKADDLEKRITKGN
jgi:tetratricopeptide (TPR) repeat protein